MVFHTKYHHHMQRDLTQTNKLNLEEDKVELLFQDPQVGMKKGAPCISFETILWISIFWTPL